ncbi:MAG: hypothetical protein ACK5LS_00605, partial [Propioniciclava sp.]
MREAAPRRPTGHGAGREGRGVLTQRQRLARVNVAGLVGVDELLMAIPGDCRVRNTVGIDRHASQTGAPRAPALGDGFTGVLIDQAGGWGSELARVRQG